MRTPLIQRRGSFRGLAAVLLALTILPLVASEASAQWGPFRGGYGGYNRGYYSRGYSGYYAPRVYGGGYGGYYNRGYGGYYAPRVYNRGYYGGYYGAPYGTSVYVAPGLGFGGYGGGYPY